ncbi:MAG: hypothetical protein ACKPKO_66040, partial [Candidatus Fonsibacter sp.]
ALSGFYDGVDAPGDGEGELDPGKDGSQSGMPPDSDGALSAAARLPATAGAEVATRAACPLIAVGTSPAATMAARAAGPLATARLSLASMTASELLVTARASWTRAKMAARAACPLTATGLSLA